MSRREAATFNDKEKAKEAAESRWDKNSLAIGKEELSDEELKTLLEVAQVVIDKRVATGQVSKEWGDRKKVYCANIVAEPSPADRWIAIYNIHDPIGLAMFRAELLDRYYQYHHTSTEGCLYRKLLDAYTFATSIDWKTGLFLDDDEWNNRFSNKRNGGQNEKEEQL